jgi:hypothetical protein
VKLHSWIRRIYLQVEGGGFDGFLLFAVQANEAGGESVSDTKFHQLKGGVCTKSA